MPCDTPNEVSPRSNTDIIQVSLERHGDLVQCLLFRGGHIGPWKISLSVTGIPYWSLEVRCDLGWGPNHGATRRASVQEGLGVRHNVPELVVVIPADLGGATQQLNEVGQHVVL